MSSKGKNVRKLTPKQKKALLIKKVNSEINKKIELVKDFVKGGFYGMEGSKDDEVKEAHETIKKRIIKRDLRNILNVGDTSDLIDLTPTMRIARMNELDDLKRQKVLDVVLATQFDEEYEDLIAKRREMRRGNDDDDDDDLDLDDLFDD